LTSDTPGSACTAFRARLWISAREGRLLAGELEREGDVPALDRQPLDEAQRHDVLAQVRVDHPPKRRQDGLLRERARLVTAE
jgi:hypothetical protein